MPELTHESLRQLLRYDPGTGVFHWLVTKGSKRPAGSVAGRPDVRRGDTIITIDGSAYRANRLAWFYMTGSWPVDEVDHKDTDYTNNRWWNLRDVAHAVNSQNSRKARVTNKTGLLGVHQCAATGRFRASITVRGKCKQLGRFDTPELAHAAYIRAKRELHDGCTL